MPRVDVWIRKDDYEIWQRIDDKPGFLRASIRAFMSTDNMRRGADLLDEVKNKKTNPVVLGVLDVIPQVQSLKFCKHNYNPKLCKFAKGGKPCK